MVCLVWGPLRHALQVPNCLNWLGSLTVHTPAEPHCWVILCVLGCCRSTDSLLISSFSQRMLAEHGAVPGTVLGTCQDTCAGDRDHLCTGLHRDSQPGVLSPHTVSWQTCGDQDPRFLQVSWFLLSGSVCFIVQMLSMDILFRISSWPISSTLP